MLLVESGILGFGIQNTAQGIRNSPNDRNPESTAWDPECKTVLDPLDMGRLKHTDIPLTTLGLKISGRNSLYVITCSCAPMILLVS